MKHGLHRGDRDQGNQGCWNAPEVARAKGQGADRLKPGYQKLLGLAEDLLQRHPLTPYVGNTFRGVFRETVRRGETIFKNGAIAASACGRLIVPQRNHDA